MDGGKDGWTDSILMNSNVILYLKNTVNLSTADTIRTEKCVRYRGCPPYGGCTIQTKDFTNTL